MVWGAPGSHNPTFVQDETNATKLEEFMVNFTNAMMKELGDYPVAWDIVNEAIGDGDLSFIKESPWSIIDDYICKAF